MDGTCAECSSYSLANHGYNDTATTLSSRLGWDLRGGANTIACTTSLELNISIYRGSLIACQTHPSITKKGKHDTVISMANHGVRNCAILSAMSLITSRLARCISITRTISWSVWSTSAPNNTLWVETTVRKPVCNGNYWFMLNSWYHSSLYHPDATLGASHKYVRTTQGFNHRPREC